jgi:hypothetical protein
MRYPATFVMLAVALTAQPTACMTGKATMQKNAQDYIAAFERGDDFHPPAEGIIAGGQPDPAALQILGNELAVGSPSVRENIVALLVDVGRRTDPLTPRGADVLRHPQILALLAGPGLAKPDLGREAAADALRKLATARDLARFEDALVKTLQDGPTDDIFLLVAKAKPAKAAQLVNSLAVAPNWKDVESAKIARAAFGAKNIEDDFLSQAAKAEASADGRALATALGSLALIGTPGSLKAAAERLRTPLTITIPGAMEKSVRVSVLEALLYNFPDEPVLYPNNVNDDAGYEAAERFCTATLGVAYTTPRPPYLKYRAFPTARPQ